MTEQIRPNHYKGKGMEAWDVVRAFNLNFNTGNVVKYVLRAQLRGQLLSDLRKALTYLEREIQEAEAASALTPSPPTPMTPRAPLVVLPPRGASLPAQSEALYATTPKRADGGPDYASMKEGAP